MADPKFYNKDGSLTQYAFGCGYLEVEKMGTHSRITLGKEHGVYHIKGFVSDVRVWEVFDHLTPARVLFRKLATIIRKLPVELKTCA